MRCKQIIESFNYIVVSLAIRYVDNILEEEKSGDLSFKQKLDRFNEDNDFSIEKVSLLPFLLTIANGNKPQLMKHFMEKECKFYFKTSRFGVIHKGLYEMLMQDNESLIFRSNQFCSTLKIDQIDTASIEAFTAQLCNRFEGEASNEFAEVLRQIDYSIIFLHSVRIPYFANKSLSSLSFWSKNNVVYKFFAPEDDENGTVDWDEKLIDLFYNVMGTETYNLGKNVVS